MSQLRLDVEEHSGREHRNAEVRIDPDAWEGAIPPPDRHQIVVGGPGTGKTEFLCRRAATAIESGTPPGEILLLGFARNGANRLRTRLIDLVGPPGHRAIVSTYHSLAMRIVEAASADLGWSAPPTVLTGLEQEQLVTELLRDEDPGRWPVAYRSILTSEAMASEVTDFLLRSREHRLDADDIRSRGRDQWRGIPEFIERYDQRLLDEGRIDYGRALDLATRHIEHHPGAIGRLALVLADEYQDTSPVQADLLFAAARTGAKLTVAADPYQSIYSFRGTDIQNVYEFPSRTEEALGTRAERLVLTTSYRVPAEILDASVAVTARELPGGAGKVLSTRTGGSVACHEFSTSGEEAEWIASDVERIHLVEQVPIDRFAVFVRSHSPFVDELVRALDRRGIAHEYTDDRLVDQPIIRFLHDVVSVAAGMEAGSIDDAPDATLRRVLAGPFVRLAPAKAASAPDDPDEWADWVANLGAEYHALADLLANDDWCTGRPANEGMWTVWSTLPTLAAVAIDHDRDTDRRAWSAYAQMLDRAAVRSPGSTLRDVVESASGRDFEADALINPSAVDGVTIATLHRSKGTEYDVVYIADATDGQLPDLRATDSMLGVRHLNPHLPSDALRYVTFRLDEERRLAYTAMTRSTSRVVWTATTATSEGVGQPPSRFMRLVGPTTPPTIDETPLTPRAFLAETRRTLSNPEAPLYERVAALLFLADRDLHGTDPLARYGTRARGGDTGLVPSELRLSPSQATMFDRCPRRYAAERYLLTIDDETVYLRLGNLIHRVLEAAESEATDKGDQRATLADALRHLDGLWPELGFGDDIVGQAWRRRSETMLTNLYELWPSSAMPIAHEIELTMELDGIPWLGRADRVERTGEAITVVDYKTGQVVSVGDAGESLQLGYYALAAADHPDIARHGTIAGAEFWYPSKPLTQKVTTRAFDMDNLRLVEERLIQIGSLIQTEAFIPTPGSVCQRCPIAGSCPAVDAGAEAFTT